MAYKNTDLLSEFKVSPSLEMLTKRIRWFYNSSGQNNGNYKKAFDEIIKSDTCTEKCIKTVLERGIFTAREKDELDKIKQDKLISWLKKESRITPNTKFETANIVNLSSSRSFQNYIIRIPTLRMQIRLELIRLALSPIPYLSSYNFSFGSYCKKKTGQFEEVFKEKLAEGKYTCGFLGKFDISDSERYFKMIKKVLPLPEWLLNRLVKSGNLSVRKLYPEQYGLQSIPSIEPIVQQFWLPYFIFKISKGKNKVFQYRNHILVLCKNNKELKRCFRFCKKIMPGFAIDFDYSSIEFFKISEGITFLGKTYKVDKNNVICEPDQRILDAFLVYVYYLIKTPLETLPEKEVQLNRLILALNLFYQGLPENFIKKYLDIITIALFENSFKQGIKSIRDEIIEIDKNGKEHISLKKFRCEGLDNILTCEDFKKVNIEVYFQLAQKDEICPLCGCPIHFGEDIMTLYCRRNRNVHRHCYDDIYQILKNLLFYPEFFPSELERFEDILTHPNEYERSKRPALKASWIYYPLYKFFLSQKKKLVRLTFKDMEEILGFKLDSKIKDYTRLKEHKGRQYLFRDTWEMAGYHLKPVKRFTGKLTFERNEPNSKIVTTHPLTEVEITSEIQKEFNACLQALLDSKTERQKR